MTNHYRRAEELLEKAAELESGPRHSVAKTLATIAQAHATLALVKATRQAQAPTFGDVHVDLPATESELLDVLAAGRTRGRAAAELSDSERATVDRFEAAPDALCSCSVSDFCAAHAVPLPAAFRTAATS